MLGFISKMQFPSSGLIEKTLKLVGLGKLIKNSSIKPLDGNCILEINPSIAFPMIDRLLGGTGENFVLTRFGRLKS